jgi:hypothetical protein
MSQPAVLEPVCPIRNILRNSPLPDLRLIQVQETAEEIILEGEVSSFYLKQLAQESIRTALGEKRLRNRVTVSRRSDAVCCN